MTNTKTPPRLLKLGKAVFEVLTLGCVPGARTGVFRHPVGPGDNQCRRLYRLSYHLWAGHYIGSLSEKPDVWPQSFT